MCKNMEPSLQWSRNETSLSCLQKHSKDSECRQSFVTLVHEFAKPKQHPHPQGTARQSTGSCAALRDDNVTRAQPAWLCTPFSHAREPVQLPRAVFLSTPFSHARTPSLAWHYFSHAQLSQCCLGRLSATSPKRLYRTNGPALLSSVTSSSLSPSGLRYRMPAPPPRRRRRQGARTGPTTVAA